MLFSSQHRAVASVGLASRPGGRSLAPARPRLVRGLALPEQQQQQQHLESDSSSSRARRQVLLSTVVLGGAALWAPGAPAETLAAQPDAGPAEIVTTGPVSESAIPPGSGRLIFLDVDLEGEPLGRIVIELRSDTDAAVSMARFADLAEGKQGLSFRRKRFNGILPDHLRVEGVPALSYSSSRQSPIAGGDNLDLLQQELAAQKVRHDSAGLVSLLVAEAEERPIKERLIARDGKLVTVLEQAGEPPNATSFAITRSSAPGLDQTNVIVGRVVEGMDVVEAVAALPFARPREQLHDAPFFGLAKSMGDKRAITAAKGFYRPLRRVIVSDCGLLT